MVGHGALHVFRKVIFVGVDVVDEVGLGDMWGGAPVDRPSPPLKTCPYCNHKSTGPKNCSKQLLPMRRKFSIEVGGVDMGISYHQLYSLDENLICNKIFIQYHSSCIHQFSLK